MKKRIPALLLSLVLCIGLLSSAFAANVKVDYASGKSIYTNITLVDGKISDADRKTLEERGATHVWFEGNDLLQTEDTPEPDEAKLTALTVSGVSLTPAFDPDVTSYTASVANEVTSVTVTPVASDGSTPVVAGNTDLTVGANTVTVTVGTKVYTITITREEPGVTPSQPTEPAAAQVSAMYTPANALTGTDKDMYFYGKLELKGLEAGDYYLVAYDNGRAVQTPDSQGNMRYPRTCFVVVGTGVENAQAMICQPGMRVSVYKLATTDGHYVIPDEFAEDIAFGLYKDNTATSVETLTTWTDLVRYSELP